MEDGWNNARAFGHDEQEKLILYQRKVIAETQEQLAAEVVRREKAEAGYRMANHSISEIAAELLRTTQRAEAAEALVVELRTALEPFVGAVHGYRKPPTTHEWRVLADVYNGLPTTKEPANA